MKVKVNRGKRNSLRRTVAQERKVKIPLKDSYIKKLRDSCSTPRETRVINIFLETGMHPEVMADPEGHSMETTRGNLTWCRPKTFLMCVWEYPDSMEQEVKEFIKNDLGLHRSTYWRLVKKVSKKAGLDDVSPLTLRHTATIRLLKTKGPEEAMRILRCSPRTLWGTYGRL